jgi:hypothetical protein
MDQNIPMGPPEFGFAIGRRMLVGWLAFVFELDGVTRRVGLSADRKRREGNHTEE